MCDKTFRLDGVILHCDLSPYTPQKERECGICRRAEANTLGHRFIINCNAWGQEIYCLLHRQNVSAFFCCNAFIDRRKVHLIEKRELKQYFTTVAEMRDKEKFDRELSLDEVD